MTLPQVVNELTRGGRESEGRADDAEIDGFLRKFRKGLI